MPLTYRKRYYLTHPRLLLRELWLPLFSFYQRGRRGWAERDAWNTDDYLARIVPEMLRYLAKHNHGRVPGKWANGAEAWETYLLKVAQAFDDYRSIATSDEMYNTDAYTETLTTMRKLFEYYLYLWD